MLISLFFVFTKVYSAENNLLDMSKLPQPDGGLRVVPSSQLSMSQEQFNEEENRLQQLSTNGFVETDNPYAQELMSYKYRGKIQIEANKDNPTPYDTHLKANASDIILAFQYQDIPVHPKPKIIGYAAMGEWKNGWAGISVFFEDPNLGVCVYSLNNLTLTHGTVNIGKDSARYDINKMPNVLDVRGNEKNSIGNSKFMTAYVELR